MEKCSLSLSYSYSATERRLCEVGCSRGSDSEYWTETVHRLVRGRPALATKPLSWFNIDALETDIEVLRGRRYY